MIVNNLAESAPLVSESHLFAKELFIELERGVIKLYDSFMSTHAFVSVGGEEKSYSPTRIIIDLFLDTV